MARTLRHICAALLVLAFALGTVTQAVQAGDMAVKLATAASSDKPMPSGCNACGDDDMGNMACGVVCAVPTAVMPDKAAVSDLQSVVITDFEDEFGVGRTGPPDPFPPKHSLLV
jgi:hypothetical protein